MNAFTKLILLAIQVMVCSMLVPFAFGDESTAAKTELEKYEIQLNAILRTRLDEEKAYVHEVIELVRLGRLPRKIVDKSVGWVRNHCADHSHGFVYFERVLRLHAERLNFQVPRFDFRVYDSSGR